MEVVAGGLCGVGGFEGLDWREGKGIGESMR